jgi:hypothetical protein
MYRELQYLRFVGRVYEMKAFNKVPCRLLLLGCLSMNHTRGICSFMDGGIIPTHTHTRNNTYLKSFSMKGFTYPTRVAESGIHFILPRPRLIGFEAFEPLGIGLLDRALSGTSELVTGAVRRSGGCGSIESKDQLMQEPGDENERSVPWSLFSSPIHLRRLSTSPLC